MRRSQQVPTSLTCYIRAENETGFWISMRQTWWRIIKVKPPGIQMKSGQCPHKWQKQARMFYACVCAAAGSNVIYTWTDSSRTYIRNMIQIHISVPVTSNLCDVTAARARAAVAFRHKNLHSAAGLHLKSHTERRCQCLCQRWRFLAVCVMR